MFYVKIHALMFYMVVHHYIKCISKYYPNLKKKWVYCGTISFQRLKVTQKNEYTDDKPKKLLIL